MVGVATYAQAASCTSNLSRSPSFRSLPLQLLTDGRLGRKAADEIAHGFDEHRKQWISQCCDWIQAACQQRWPFPESTKKWQDEASIKTETHKGH